MSATPRDHYLLGTGRSRPGETPLDPNIARRIYANLKPVYDVMGGDLVSACLERGIPAALLRAIMIEWRESEARMNRVIAALRDDSGGGKQVTDDMMKRFEDMHDGLGRIRPRRSDRLGKSSER